MLEREKGSAIERCCVGEREGVCQGKVLCWRERWGLLGKGSVLEREKGSARKRCCVGKGEGVC